MSWVFNPFTGKFDFAGAGSGTVFNPDWILTGPTENLYAGDTAPLEVLIDHLGNVLTVSA